MNYIKDNNNNQDFLKIPSTLERFTNTYTEAVKDKNNNEFFIFHGYVTLCDEDLVCE